MLSIWWLKSDHRVAEYGPVLNAATANWVELERLPDFVREALERAMAAAQDWSQEDYVPSSNQRVVWPEEWSDPELTILEPHLELRVPIDGSIEATMAAVIASIASGDGWEELTQTLRGAELGRRTMPAWDGRPGKAREAEPDRPKPQAHEKDSKHRLGPRKTTARKAAPRRDGTASPSAKGRGPRCEWFTVTAYCPCKKCCGRWAKYHRTASGLPLTYNGGHLVAADTRVLPFHTRVRIPGYADGRPVPVVDRGSAVKGHMIDVFFPTHAQAKRWGKKRLLVEIVP